jgi:hypothetical protein
LSPRLKSRLWVEALLRRCAGEGKYGAVIHPGADEAGAVFVAINRLDNTYDLLEPPPGPSHDEAGNRHFTKAFASPAPWADVQALIARRRKVDADLWLVEIEDRNGLAGLTLLGNR